MKSKIKSIGILLVVIIFSSTAYAFGVSAPYWSGNPLIVSPGESQEFKFTLQNTAGSNNVSLRCLLEKGSEISEIKELKDAYFMPIGSYLVLNILVKAPTEPIGASYDITLTCNTIAESTKGAFGIGTSISKTVPVLISETQPSLQETITPQPEINKPLAGSNLVIYAVIIAIIVLIVIIYLALRRKKK